MADVLSLVADELYALAHQGGTEFSQAQHWPTCLQWQLALCHLSSV